MSFSLMLDFDWIKRAKIKRDISVTGGEFLLTDIGSKALHASFQKPSLAASF